MVCSIGSFSDFERQQAREGGVFLSTSGDGIHWGEPKKLLTGLPVPYRGREYVGHPALLLESVTEKKAEGWLVYAFSERWGTAAPNVPHYCCRRRITLTNN
jgi:hypothetical protein